MNPAAPVTKAFIAEPRALATPINNHEDTRNLYLVNRSESWLAISPDNSSRTGRDTMRNRLMALVGVLGATWAIGGLAAWESLATPKPPRAADQGREAIEKSSREFAAAFERRDAKAIAGLWTENGEYEDESGELLTGRAAIEKAYADFFQEQPPAKIDVRIESIRFPSADCAIEEGMLRQVRGGKELPSSTLYRAFHVRENGQWRIASAREWGAGFDRLGDLDWLIGDWKGAARDDEFTLSFARDDKESCIVSKTLKRANGKDQSAGTMRIALDPQRSQLQSWHFDSDGGHGQSLWIRDGNSWVLDAIGVGGDGADTESVNILSRIGPNEITWRSIDRVVNGQPLPDTVPVKLTRVTK